MVMDDSYNCDVRVIFYKGMPLPELTLLARNSNMLFFVVPQNKLEKNGNHKLPIFKGIRRKMLKRIADRVVTIRIGGNLKIVDENKFAELLVNEFNDNSQNFYCTDAGTVRGNYDWL